MNERADAVRYGRELFDVTWRHDQAAAVADELDVIAEAMREHRGEARPLFHPLVSQARKQQTVGALVGSLGLSKPTSVLLHALLDAHQIHLVPVVADSFRARLNHKTGVIQARVTTAAPLAPEKAAALADRLQQISGRKVQLQTTIDPSVIGGVVAQVDSTVYDGSVARQLARMRQKLVENV
jgi:F-type H+-transporting ATPase subunit delta